MLDFLNYGDVVPCNNLLLKLSMNYGTGKVMFMSTYLKLTGIVNIPNTVKYIGQKIAEFVPNMRAIMCPTNCRVN